MDELDDLYQDEIVGDDYDENNDLYDYETYGDVDETDFDPYMGQYDYEIGEY